MPKPDSEGIGSSRHRTFSAILPSNPESRQHKFVVCLAAVELDSSIPADIDAVVVFVVVARPVPPE